MELLPFIGICLLAGPFLAAAEVGDQYTAVFTPGDGLGEYNRAWVTVPHEWFEFRVKASKNAKIALTSEPYDLKNGATYEVILGQKDNMQSVIKTEIGSTSPAVNSKTANLLSESAYLDIWITWDNSKLSVGTGKERGIDEFLTLTDPNLVKNLPQIFAVSFDTDAVNGFFEFAKDSGPTTYLHTYNHGIADDEFAWISEHYSTNIIFAVEFREPNIPTQSAIKLLLCREIWDNDSNCYKIKLGQTTSSIGKYTGHGASKDIASEDHGAILTQNEYRYFWVSWFQGYIEVGEGHEVGYRRLVHGQTSEAAENSTFTAISIGSGGTVQNGAWWQFHLINQNNFLLQTAWWHHRTESNWINVEGHHSFVFEVRADSDASIILLSDISQKEHSDVVIHMNPEKERGTAIIDVYDKKGDRVGGLKGTGVDINRNEFKPVWISWTQGVIKIGAGVNPGYKELMSYNPFEFDENYVQPEIRGLYLNDAAREGGEDIQWLFPTDSGKATTIYTGFMESDTDWIVVIDSYSQVFSVKSPGMLMIDLCQYLGNRMGKYYSVVVGSPKETGHIVSSISKGDNRVEESTPDIISADDFHFIWISWRNSIITLGMGAIEGQNPVVSYDDSRNSDKYQVNAIGFTAMGEAEWHFGNQQGPHYAVQTNFLEETWYEAWFDSPRGLFTFSVQSCEMVEVWLHRSPGAPLPGEGFKIQFSSVTGTTITDMKTGQSENKNLTNEYSMDCTENKFWISWVESIIKVGQGDPMLNVLVSMDHQHDPLSLRYIKGVSLRSISSNIQPALWTIPKSIGKTMSVRNTESTPIVISTDNKQSITFRVAAERSATITLQSVQQANSANTVRYRVILGDDWGMYVKITDFTKQSQPGTGCSHYGVVNKDEMRWFWISWSGGAIRVGKGNIVGEHRLCDLTIESSNPSIFYVSAHTPTNVFGDWYFSSIEDRQFSVVTPPGQKEAGYPVVMRTARPYFQFNLRACFDAIIELGSQTEPVFKPQYTIHIGDGDNTRLTIYDVDFPDVPVVVAAVPDMLNCGEMRPYWVSWENGNIEIGTGRMPGYAVADYRDSSYRPVVGVALENWDHHKKATDASWEFSELSVSSLRVETPAPLNLHQFWITVVHQTQIVFRLKSTGNVMITLSKTPEVVTDNTYLLELGWGDNADTYNLKYDGVLKKTRKIPADIMGGGSEFKMWRISWEGRAIHVRQDHILILDYDMKDDANMHITSMAVASNGTHGITEKSIFEFDNLQANDYFFKTDKGMGEDTTDIILGSSEVAFKDIEFVVRSEQYVQIDMAVKQSFPSDKLYLCINYFEYAPPEYRTYIKDESGKILCEIDRQIGMLSKTEDRRFWISWNEKKVGKSTIKVGWGTLYTNELLSCESDKKPNILSFTSPNGDAFWTITKEQVEAFWVYETMNNYEPRLWENVAGEGEAVVHIVTSSDAQIYLSSTAGVIDLATYKIEIQRSFDNLTYITDTEKGEILDSDADNARLDLLDGYNPQPFYIDWGSICEDPDVDETCKQFLDLGKGASMNGDDSIVATIFEENDMHTINALGVNLPKGGVVVMLNSEADTYSLTTHGDMKFRKHWFYMKSPKFSFKVQACSDVVIALNTKSPEDWGDATFYEILLGAHDNSKSLIRRRNSEDPVIEVDTPMYLSCYEKRQFWIHYNDTNGVLEMGTGAMMTHNFMTWTVPGAADIHAVSVGTDKTLGLWEIKQNLGPAKFQVVRRYSGGRLATVAEVLDDIDNVLEQLDTVCSEWCVARLADGIVRGSNYYDYQRTGPIDPNHDEAHEVIIISDAETFHYDHKGEEATEITWVNVIGRNEIRFQVRACEDARLVLADIPGQWNTHTREIRIGIDNVYTAIYDSYNSSDKPLKREDSYGVLDCYEHKEFWMSWDFHRIDIGTGVADDRILRYTKYDPSNPIFINSIGLYSRPGKIWDGGIDSNWILGNINDTIPPVALRDDYFTLFTHGPWSSLIRTFNVFGTGFVFTVKAKEQAIIYLSEKPGQHEKGTFKIVIGANGNKNTTIENLDIPGSLQEFSSPDILNEYQDKEFWVSWILNAVFIGTGHVIDKEDSQIAALEDNEVKNIIIHQVALASGAMDGKAERWRIKKDSGRYFNFTTRPFSSEKYEEAWYSSYAQNYCVFQVKAQADAYILLSDRTEETDHVYEIVLGYEGNKKAGIRNITGATGGEGARLYEVEERAEGFLDANELRYFWVRWNQGVEVGDGRVVGQNRFLNFHDPIDRHIKHLSFANDNAGVAEWHIHNSEAETFTIRTPGDDNFDHIWIYPSGHHFEFEVTGCIGANILLAREPYVNNTKDNTVEVIIADNDCDPKLGQCVKLRWRASWGDKPHTKEEYYDGPDGLLDCHSARKFWITWYDERLIIGRGTLLSEGEWKFDNFYLTFPVRALALSAENVVVPLFPFNLITWDFHKDLARTTVFDTLATYSYRMHWLNTFLLNSVKFKVKACGDVRLMLSEFFGVGGSYAYEVWLDKKDPKDNSISSVILEHADDKYDGEGRTMASSTQVQLDEHYSKWFWITWPGNQLHVGSGPIVENDIIMSWEMPPGVNRHAIEAIAFEAGECDARWEFTELPDRMFEVVTLFRPPVADEPEGAENYAWVWLHRKYFAFSVQACSNAHISLMHYAGSDNNPNNAGYIIQLDYEDGKSLIYDHNKRLVAHADTGRKILDCNVPAQMWISWLATDNGNRKLVVGNGELFTGEIMSYEDTSDKFGIHVASLETPLKWGEVNNIGHWLFRDDSGIKTQFFSGNNFTYDNNVYRVASLDATVFWIQAEMGAYVFLFDHYHTAASYQIELGPEGNQDKIFLRKARDDINSLAMHGTDDGSSILDGKVLQPFWVSWAQARITLGRGEVVGNDPLIDYHDQDKPFSVSYLSFATYAENNKYNDGLWQFYNVSDDTFLVSNYPNQETDDVWFTFSPQQKMYKFSVRACKDAIVQLVSGGQDSGVIFDITLGANDNTRTILRKQDRDSMVVVATQITPDVLNCYEDRWFILKWEKSLVELYVTSETGRQIIEYYDETEETEEIHGLTLHTEDVFGEWQMPRNPGKALRIKQGRHAAERYCCLWLTVLQRKFIVFSVKASQHASIVLSETPGVTTGRVYEIIIGEDNNQFVTIKDGLDGVGEQKVTSGKGTYLSSTEFRSFFISWKDDDIVIGSGTVPANGGFLQYKSKHPFPVRALSVANEDLLDVVWEFSQISGNQFLTSTTDKKDYSQAVIMPKENQFIFGVKADANAHIALSTYPNDTKKDTYEVVIGAEDNEVVIMRDLNKPDDWYPDPEFPLLDNRKVMYFWLEWIIGKEPVGDEEPVYGTILLGRGEIVGEDTIGMYHPSTVELRNITSISMSTDGSVGEWEWDFHQEKMLAFSLPELPLDVEKYAWITVQGYNAIVFRVRAKYHAKIILTATQGDVTTDTTMITIGENYNPETHLPDETSAIYRINGAKSTLLESLRTHNILDAKHFRAFWVRWNLNEIQIGTGAEIGSNSFLRHVDQNIHYTSAIALSKSAEYKAEYEILTLYGNTYNVYTPGDSLLMYGESRPVLFDEYVGEVKVTAGEFSFTLESCGHAIVTLLPGEELVENGTPCYQVVLGGNANNRVSIEKLLTCDRLLDIDIEGVTTLNSVEVPSVLDCKVDRRFWVHWNYAGLVRVGSGFRVGSFELLRHEDSNPTHFTRVHLSSELDNPAAWVTSQKPGEVVTYTTPKGYQYNTTFISVLDKNFILFKVAACQGAHIALSHVPQNVWVNTYEVVLGAEDNRKVEIREGVRGPVMEDECLSDCANTIHCTDLRPFWIQWGDGQLAVGTGGEPGLDSTRLITYKDFDLKSVTTIAFASFTGNMGWWEVAYTPPDLGFEHATTPAPTTTPVPTTAALTTPTDPPTTPSTPPPTTTEYIPSHSVILTLHGNYSTIVGNMEEFEAEMKSQLEEELGEKVFITRVYEGSIIVEFTTEAKMEDILELENWEFQGLDGQTNIGVDDVEADIVPTASPTDGKSEDTGGMSGGESFGVAVGIIALIVLVVVLAFFGYRYWQARPSVASIPVHFSNPGYTEEKDNFNAKVIFPVDDQPSSKGNGYDQ